MKKLLRSGWWVAVAAGAVVVVSLLMLVRPGPSTLRGDGSDPETYGFNLSCLQGPDDAIIGGGMSRDGLRALDEPAMIAGSEVSAANEAQRGKLLVSTDRVIGVEINGEARAYPLRLMRWHEVVNDIVGGSPVAVTYSGLCDASAVWDRMVDGSTRSFGVSGLVHDSNTIIYDRSSPEPSLWSQLTGLALAGPAACSGLSLRGLPAEIVAWSDWLNRHPDTLVMTPLADLKRLYKRDPYHSYFGSEMLHFPIDPPPPQDGPAAKDHVAVIELGGQRQVIQLASVPDTTQLEIDGVPIRLHAAADPSRVRLETMTGADVQPTLRLTFWFAWHAQNPDDGLWSPR